MRPTANTLVSIGVLVASATVLSGCSLLEDWGLMPAAESVVEDIVIPDEPATPAEGDDALVPEDTGFVIPGCDQLFSAAQVAALTDQARVNIGDTSEGDYAYGTTNPDLVGLLKNVRSDLRISCTWYLPASESVSVTSVAVITSDEASAVSAALVSAGATEQAAGSGIIRNVNPIPAGESEDYIATESHFLAPVPCPSSLAETSCTAWISSNYAFGQAEALTMDAAKNLGAFSG